MVQPHVGRYSTKKEHKSLLHHDSIHPRVGRCSNKKEEKEKKKKKTLGDDDLVAELGKVSLTVFVLSDLTRLVSLRSSSANLNWGIL